MGEIDNPEYEPNDKLYIHPNPKYIEYAKKFADDTYGKMAEIEKAKYDKAREEEAEIARKEREEFEAMSKLEEQEAADAHEAEEEEEEEEEEEDDHDGTEL